MLMLNFSKLKRFLVLDWPVYLVILLGIIFRFYIWFEFPSDCCPNDEIYFTKIAQNIIQYGDAVYTKIDDPYIWTDIIYGAKPPLYSYFLAIFFQVFGNFTSVVKVVQIIIGSLSGILVYYITLFLVNRLSRTKSQQNLGDNSSHKLYSRGKNQWLFDESRRTAFFSLIVYIISWEIAFLNQLYLSENLYMPLLLALIYLVIKLKEGLVKYYILAGVCLGLLILVRPPAIIFVLPIIVYIIANKRDYFTMRNLLIGAISLVVILLPWQIRNYAIFEKFVFVYTDGGVNFWMGNYPGGGGGYNFPDPKNPGEVPVLTAEGPLQEIERDQYYYKEGFRFMQENPGLTLDRGFGKLMLTFSLYRPGMLNTTGLHGDWFLARPISQSVDWFLQYLVTLQFSAIQILTFAGVVVLFVYRKTNSIFWLLVSFFGLTVFGICLTHAEPRYYYQIYPMMIPFTGIPLARIFPTARKN